MTAGMVLGNLSTLALIYSYTYPIQEFLLGFSHAFLWHVGKSRDSFIFRKMPYMLCIAIVSLIVQVRGNEPIRDPIADYLGMNVPDRASNAGHLLIVKKVEVDLEGNGKSDVFIGTWYRHSGPNTWLWTGYAPIEGGYKRITPADSDVLIDFGGIYVGDLPEIGRHGMAQAYS